MEPVAILITEDNCDTYAIELRWGANATLRSKPSKWIGYYLVVTEGGPELLTPVEFVKKWEFVINNDRYQPIRSKV
jgi:hypothetical protein